MNLGRSLSLILSWVSYYLPILVLVGLVMGSYWMLRQEPELAKSSSTEVKRPSAPDYFMQNAVVRTFGPQGDLNAQVRGKLIQHYADSGIYEIQKLALSAQTRDESMISANADTARSNADFSEVHLLGNIHAELIKPDALPTTLKADFLQVFVPEQRIASSKPILIERGDSIISADSFSYDRLYEKLEMKGRVHINWAPASAPPTPIDAAK